MTSAAVLQEWRAAAASSESRHSPAAVAAQPSGLAAQSPHFRASESLPAAARRSGWAARRRRAAAAAYESRALGRPRFDGRGDPLPP